jgi:hypothetical protein
MGLDNVAAACHSRSMHILKYACISRMLGNGLEVEKGGEQKGE